MPVIKHKDTGAILYDGTASGMAGLDLSNADFRGQKTAGALSGADFTGTNLTGADFSGVNFLNVSFAGATIANASFDGSTLTSCDFTDAVGDNVTLRNAYSITSTFGSTLTTTLNGWDLSGAYISGTLAGEFSNRTMETYLAEGAHFSSINFSGSDFNSTLYSVVFTGCSNFNFVTQSAYNCVIRNANGFSLMNSTLERCLFEGGITSSAINAATMRYCIFRAALNSCSTGGESYHNCEIGVPNFFNSAMNGSTFNNTEFSYQIFAPGSVLNGVVFNHCNITNGQSLTGVTVNGMTYNNCTINGMDTSGASTLFGFYLNNSSVSNLSMIGSIPTNTMTFSFSGNAYNNASLSNATLNQKNLNSLENCTQISNTRIIPDTDASTANRPGAPMSSKLGSYSSIKDSVYAGLRISSSYYYGPRPVNVDFGNSSSPVHAGNSVFRDCSFAGVTFDTSSSPPFLDGTTFVGCDFKGADLSAVASTQNCKFSGCDLSFANFSGALLTGTSFYGCNVFSTNFTGATDADLTGSFSSSVSETVEGSVTWASVGTPYSDTAVANSGLVLAVYLTAGSTYEFDVSGGGAAQNLYWVSPKQALMWSKENRRPSLELGGVMQVPYDNINIIKASTGTDANISPFMCMSSGYHYLYLYNDAFSSSYTITATVS